jgi:hypothetical protein
MYAILDIPLNLHRSASRPISKREFYLCYLARLNCYAHKLPRSLTVMLLAIERVNLSIAWLSLVVHSVHPPRFLRSRLDCGEERGCGLYIGARLESNNAYQKRKERSQKLRQSKSAEKTVKV